MITRDANFPPFKSDIKKAFGFLSFQCLLLNLDIIGVRSKKTYDIIAVLYRGKNKVGHLYDSGAMTEQEVFKIYNLVPEDYNDLHNWEKSMADKIEILVPPKDNYVFINDREVVKQRIKK